MFLSSSKDVPISFPKCSPRCSQRVPQILKLFPNTFPISAGLHLALAIRRRVSEI